MTSVLHIWFRMLYKQNELSNNCSTVILAGLLLCVCSIELHGVFPPVVTEGLLCYTEGDVFVATTFLVLVFCWPACCALIKCISFGQDFLPELVCHGSICDMGICMTNEIWVKNSFETISKPLLLKTLLTKT